MEELWTYKKAGVDIEAADDFVFDLKKLVKKTYNDRVVAGVGPFAGLFKLNEDRYLAAATDGVGTKLKWSIESGIHHSIGIDLVAMCCNDLLCVGATPLFFLDYIAVGKLDKDMCLSIMEGLTNALKELGVCLLGGETAEMPGLYGSKDYDLAGFSVGELNKKELIKNELDHGDVLIAFPSSGFHANGHSLLRKFVNEKKYYETLLTPTKLYGKNILPFHKKNLGLIKGLCHITGGGFNNLLRLSENFIYNIRNPLELKDLPGKMGEIINLLPVSKSELYRTFNMGIGMVMVVDRKDVSTVLEELSMENPWILGDIQQSNTTEWLLKV